MGSDLAGQCIAWLAGSTAILVNEAKTPSYKRYCLKSASAFGFLIPKSKVTVS
jgi:hypothetical protein